MDIKSETKIIDNQVWVNMETVLELLEMGKLGDRLGAEHIYEKVQKGIGYSPQLTLDAVKEALVLIKEEALEATKRKPQLEASDNSPSLT